MKLKYSGQLQLNLGCLCSRTPTVRKLLLPRPSGLLRSLRSGTTVHSKLRIHAEQTYFSNCRCSTTQTAQKHDRRSNTASAALNAGTRVHEMRDVRPRRPADWHRSRWRSRLSAGHAGFGLPRGPRHRDGAD